MKRQATDWGETVTNHVSGKGLMSRIYLKNSKLSSKKPNDPIRKWTRDLNRYFTEENIQVAKRQIKRHSTALVIRENCGISTHLLEQQK